MTDYGHDLSFGTFITPQNRQPQHVVHLAQLTERAGLDLVTFMDHPYSNGLLDTWTLLSYVAARTDRVRLSGYVLNLPLRPPAVLARAAASLDLPSDGRFELGIGPGDTLAAGAVAAMGGPAGRTPNQLIGALDEAIDIIRATWDADLPGAVDVDGEQYRVRGAARGPRPAHDISIWLPAGGPRARRLVGRKADGWITGGAWMHDVDAELAAGNRLIDEAALKAGRDPSAVRRIFDFLGSFDHRGNGYVQGPADRWVDTLLPLVVDHGVSTFILITDDPRTIATFGADGAPALRDSVANERNTPAAPAR